MNKPYQLLLALGIAAASLSSCSRANYVVNTTVPTHLSSEKYQAQTPAQELTVATPTQATTTASGALYETATVKAARPAVEVVKEVAQPVAVASPAPEVAAATTVASPKAKPSLVQRLAVKSIVKQLTKLQQKQATAHTAQTASKKGSSALIALAGILVAVIGLIIVGGSGLGGSGAGVAIGAILFYVGFIAFIVGLVLLVIHLVNND
ncbi:MAG: hypothetical protein EOO60_09990 [Hymenobacter sp.]|nr:MAG: hypothetical protein EOO60_09990 [Hymenobacter sp.]